MPQQFYIYGLCAYRSASMLRLFEGVGVEEAELVTVPARCYLLYRVRDTPRIFSTMEEAIGASSGARGAVLLVRVVDEQEPETRLYTQEETAELLRVSIKTVARMRADGRIAFVRMGAARGRAGIFHTEAQIREAIERASHKAEAKKPPLQKREAVEGLNAYRQAAKMLEKVRKERERKAAKERPPQRK
jgi:excisionase family DNA binding protein